MREIEAVVEDGVIRLPETSALPDGTKVRVMWEERSVTEPYEQEELTVEDVLADLRWSTGRRVGR